MSKEFEQKKPIPWRRFAWFGGGVLAAIIGFLLAFQWSSDRANSFLAFGTIIFWAAAIFFAYKGWIYEVEKVIITGAKRPTKKVNSLNIYPRLTNEGKIAPGCIVFEDTEHPKGQPMRCLDDGLSYYVHIWDMKEKALVPFLLPDGQYFDPGEFGNVLEMPAHKRLFTRKMSMLQKMGPWIMCVALIVSLFILAVFIPK